jgi:hypothetical protein
VPEDKSGTALTWFSSSSVVITRCDGQAPGQRHRNRDTMSHDKVKAGWFAKRRVNPVIMSLVDPDGFMAAVQARQR